MCNLSNSSKKIVFKIPFNIPMDMIYDVFTEYAAKSINNPTWIKQRVNIFMTYTLKSLKNQTCQDFMAYILYYKPSENALLKLISQYPPLPSHIQFIPEEDYTCHVTNYITGSTDFYEVELASDDLYHQDFVNYLYNYIPLPDTLILICQNGYIYSSLYDKLAEYFNYSSCFNCWLYKTQDFLDGVRYKYRGFVGAIEQPHELIPWRCYINHSHGRNIAFSYKKEEQTPWGAHRAHIGASITNPDDKASILKTFLG